MDTTQDNPLDVPLRTLQAIEMAGAAARRARQAIEASRAGAWAGLAMAIVGTGAYLIASNALSAWAEGCLAGVALVTSIAGTILAYGSFWRARSRAARAPLRETIGSATPADRRVLISYFAVWIAVQALAVTAFLALRGRIPDAIFYGIMIWGVRLGVLELIAVCIYRYVRVGFWEYLVFAAAISGTGGLYIFANRNWGLGPAAQGSLAALSLVVTWAAAWSMLARNRRWRRDVRNTAVADFSQGEAAG